MTRGPPRQPMRDRKGLRPDRRGLAEIVGTLMLVLIVVAAATAFSFFVASEEQTNLREQNQLHLKNLENVTIQSVANVPGYVIPPPAPRRFPARTRGTSL